MKETFYIIIFIIVFYIVFILKDSSLTSFTDGDTTVYVRDGKDMEQSAQLLTELTKKMFELRDYLVHNIDTFDDKDKDHVNLLKVNFTKSRTKIYETDFNSSYTSYAVNKGEEIAFCIRCKPSGELHNINLLMYVAVHEMAHTACSENGHTALFNYIFKFMLNKAVDIKLYTYENYQTNPVTYCGMNLHTNVLNN